MSESTPRRTDDDFRYLGLSEAQISLLAGHDDGVREIVYEEALRLLASGGDMLEDFGGRL